MIWPASSCCPVFFCCFTFMWLILLSSSPAKLCLSDWHACSCWGYFSSLSWNCRCCRFLPVSRFCRVSAAVVSAPAAWYSWNLQLELCLACGFPAEWHMPGLGLEGLAGMCILLTHNFSGFSLSMHGSGSPISRAWLLCLCLNIKTPCAMWGAEQLQAPDLPILLHLDLEKAFMDLI